MSFLLLLFLLQCTQTLKFVNARSKESLHLFINVTAIPRAAQSFTPNNSFVSSNTTELSDDGEDDGEALERMNSRNDMYGDNYMNETGFLQNYANQWQNNFMSSSMFGNWVSLGPTTADSPYVESGRIRCMVQDTSNKNLVYVLFSGGGLWKTSNFFDTYPNWVPLTDNLYTTSGGSFALGQSSGNIYLGLGDPFSNVGIGGLFTLSTDGGNTWSTPEFLWKYQSNTNFKATAVFDIKVDTSSSTEVVIVSTNAGILRSVDGGITFTHPYSGASSYYGTVYSIVLTSKGWIGYDSSNQMFLLSADRGASWSTPPGSNWASVTGFNSGLALGSSGAERTTFAVGKSGDGIVYALAAATSSNPDIDHHQLDVFRSTDGGLTWKALGCNSNGSPTNPKIGLQEDLDILDVQGWYNQMLLVDPADSSRNTVYIGGMSTSAKTTNGGKQWTIITTWTSPASYQLPYVHSDFHAASFMTSSTGVRWMVFGTDGGFFRTSDNGVTWSNSLNTGLTSHLVQYVAGSPLLPSYYVIGLQDLGTRARVSNTTKWVTYYGGDGEGCGYSQSVNKLLVVSYYGNNFAFATYDSASKSFGSATTTTVGIDPTETTVFFTNLGVPRASSDPTGTVFFTFTYQSIYRSSYSSKIFRWIKIGTNGVTTGLSSTLFRASYHCIGIGLFSTSQVAVAKDTGLVITTNGGATWTSVTISTTINGWSKTSSPLWASYDGMILYAASESPKVGAPRLAKSTDGGKTWALRQSGLPDVPVVRLVSDETDVFGGTVFAATWVGVYYTSNGGYSWNKVGSDLPSAVVNDIYYNPGKLVVATYGRGVWGIAVPAASPSMNNTMSFKGTIAMTGISASEFTATLNKAVQKAVANVTGMNSSFVSTPSVTDVSRRLSKDTVRRLRETTTMASSVQVVVTINAPLRLVGKLGGFATIASAFSNTAAMRTALRLSAKRYSIDLSQITVSSSQLVNLTPTGSSGSSPTASPVTSPAASSPSSPNNSVNMTLIVVVVSISVAFTLVIIIILCIRRWRQKRFAEVIPE